MLALNGIQINDLSIGLNEPVGVLLFAEFPTTVIYSDNDGNPVIKEWVDCSDDGKVDRFFYFKISKRLLHQFIKRELSHQDLIGSAIDGFLYFEDTSAEKTSYALVSVNQFPRPYIPSANYFVKESDLVDADKVVEYFKLEDVVSEISVFDEVKAIAIKRNSETLNIHIKEGKGVGFGTIDSVILGKTLLSFEKLYQDMALDHIRGKQRGTNDKKGKSKTILPVATEVYERIAASFSVLIRPKVVNLDLFSSATDSQIIFSKALSLITSGLETSELEKEYTNHSDYTINSFKSFLKVVYESQLDLNLDWFNPINSSEWHEEIGFVKANSIINNIESLNILSEESFKKVGKFRAINLNTNHFYFTDTQDDEYNGYFDKQLKEGIERIKFTDIYEVSIERKTSKEPGIAHAKVTDKIMAFYDIK